MVNHMILQGRLTRDPELNTTANGVPVCSFTVAWSDRYKENENRLFLNVTAWRGMAEMICRNFTKGREIVVEGRLQQREWTDKEGNNRSTIEMQSEKVHFCGPKVSDGSNAPDIPDIVPEQKFADLDEEMELPWD